MDVDDGADKVRTPTKKLENFDAVYELQRKTSSDDETSEVHRSALVTSEQAIVARHPTDIRPHLHPTSVDPTSDVTWILNDNDDDDVGCSRSSDSEDRQTMDSFVLE